MRPTVTASLILLPLLLRAAPAPAADSNFVMDPEPVRPRDIKEGVARQEATAGLPPWPHDADLIAFVPDGPPTPFKYFIDGKNLRIDQPAAVVRYTLVTEATSGTRNVSYEGLHCTLKGAYKVYAYGNDGRFTPAPAPDWLPLPKDGLDPAREDLFHNRFCIPLETHPRSLKEILRALRGRGAANDAAGFHMD
jgi:hypothetical protein